jgi:hypothetical protein
MTLLNLIPLFGSPCDLARRLPSFVAEFLDLETTLRRRFREDSITDLLVAAMLRLADPNLIVFVPENESVTGNDFDIIIFDHFAREAIQYRIQAKRLKPHKANWHISSYTELAHPSGTGAQSLSLVRSAAAEKFLKTIPLYAFYNPARTCAASGGLIEGIELADGKAIRAVIVELIKSKPKRPPLKRIGTLQPLFFPLTTLLCPSGPPYIGGPSIPSPGDSFRAVSSAIEEASGRFIRTPAPIPVRIISDLSENGERTRTTSLQLKEKLPPVLEEALKRRDAEAKERVVRAPSKRTRVVLFTKEPSRE